MRDLFKKIRSLFFQLTSLEQFDTDYSPLSNVKPISNAEKKAQQIIKQYPHLKQSDIIKDTENGWIRVSK